LILLEVIFLTFELILDLNLMLNQVLNKLILDLNLKLNQALHK